MCGLMLQICVKILSGFQTIISCVWVIAYSKGKIIIKQSDKLQSQLKSKTRLAGGELISTEP